MKTPIELHQKKAPKNDALIEKFLQLWKDREVHDNLDALGVLNDNDYIMYKMWEQIHQHDLFKEFLPNTTLFSGSAGRTDQLIFHGGCQSCNSQDIHGVNRCKGCLYFRWNWNKADLSKDPEPETERLEQPKENSPSRLTKLLNRLIS